MVPLDGSDVARRYFGHYIGRCSSRTLGRRTNDLPIGLKSGDPSPSRAGSLDWVYERLNTFDSLRNRRHWYSKQPWMLSMGQFLLTAPSNGGELLQAQKAIARVLFLHWERLADRIEGSPIFLDSKNIMNLT